MCELEEHVFFCTGKNSYELRSMSLSQWLTNFFLKGPDCKYFMLRGPRGKIKDIMRNM